MQMVNIQPIVGKYKVSVPHFFQLSAYIESIRSKKYLMSNSPGSLGRALANSRDDRGDCSVPVLLIFSCILPYFPPACQDIHLLQATRQKIGKIFLNIYFIIRDFVPDCLCAIIYML